MSKGMIFSHCFRPKPLMLIIVLTIASYAAVSCDDGAKVDGKPPFVSGAVTDSATGAALDSVLICHVTSSGIDFLTMTDHSGQYSLGLRFGSSSYVFKRLGYKEKQYLLPDEAEQIADYQFHLDVVLAIH